MAAKDELDLKGMLLSTGLVQPVKSESRGGRVAILCRLVPGQESAWLRAVERLLQELEQFSGDFTLHVCKQFLLRNGVMVAGWFIAIDAKGTAFLRAALNSMRPIFETLQPDLVSEEAPAPLPVIIPKKKQAAPASVPEEDEEEEEAQPVTQDLVKRRMAYLKKTTATPRAPAALPAGFSVPDVPEDVQKPHVVFRGQAVDSKGRTRQVVIEEMALPSVYANDMNRPNDKGRGATTLG